VRQHAEREADYHAGFVIGRMGAPYERTIDVVRWLPGAEAGGYPSRAQRLCEIGRGWRDAKRLEAIAAVDAADSGGGALVCEDRQPDPARFQLRANRDIHGHDIRIAGRPGIPGIDLAACAARCEAMPACKAFSFDRWHGWCFLKDRIVESLVDPPSVIGVKRPAALPGVSQSARGQIIVVRNRRFHDAPREPPRTADTFDACKGRCNATTNCVAFSYMKTSRMCSIFDKTVGHYIDDRADSGYKRQERSAE
jgi:hypothetical protein